MGRRLGSRRQVGLSDNITTKSSWFQVSGFRFQDCALRVSCLEIRLVLIVVVLVLVIENVNNENGVTNDDDNETEDGVIPKSNNSSIPKFAITQLLNSET